MKSINLYVNGGFISAWHGEAVTLSKELGYQLTTPYWAHNDLLQCSFPNYVFKKNFEKLIREGYKISFFSGKVKECNLIGVFGELDDLEYIKYDQFTFTDSADNALLETEFDVATICSKIDSGHQNKQVKKYCLNILTIFGEELQFLKTENNIEEYWKNKKEAIKKAANTSKKAEKLIDDLDKNLIYGNIDAHFEEFRRRILKARKYANFNNATSVVKFYNLIYFGIENENSIKKSNLVARMLFCSITDEIYDETLKVIFSSPEKFYTIKEK